ncbi:MAG: lysophospholipid acyltransferase family protein [bacterium]|nr:lysophospholipid acyltransferase family protein [bacterium]
MKAATRRRLRSRIARPLTFVFKLVAGTLSWRSAQRLGARLGGLIWRVGERDRQRTLAHLEVAFPELSESERFELGRRATTAIGINFAEYFHLAHRGPGAAVPHLDVLGWEHVEAARAQAQVVMIATGHCGNWELMGPVFRSKNELLTGLVRSMENEWMEAAMNRFRRRLGSEVIARGEPGSASRLLSLRKRGGYLLALIDQDIRAQSVYVPFFGRPAHTPVGPAQMALRWSMPVVPGFCERLEDGSHRVEFGPRLPRYDRAEELTAAITRAIEEQVRRRPDQWVWMHRRWRRQLPDDTEFLARDPEGSRSG